MTTTAQKIIDDPKNSLNGEVQHYRIATAADQENEVEIKGTRNNPCYKFADGSSMSINHTLGDYSLDA